MKENIGKVYYKRIRLVLTTELKSTNIVESVIALTLPEVQYNFDIIDWYFSEPEILGKKLLASNSTHIPKTDNHLLYLTNACESTSQSLRTVLLFSDAITTMSSLYGYTHTLSSELHVKLFNVFNLCSGDPSNLANILNSTFSWDIVKRTLLNSGLFLATPYFLISQTKEL